MIISYWKEVTLIREDMLFSKRRKMEKPDSHMTSGI
jgi:hypothetical protein